jgi:hypothetical protein
MPVTFPHAGCRSYKSFVLWKIAVWIYALAWLTTPFLVWWWLRWPAWMKFGLSFFILLVGPTTRDLFESYSEYRSEVKERPPSESAET